MHVMPHRDQVYCLSGRRSAICREGCWFFRNCAAQFIKMLLLVETAALLTCRVDTEHHSRAREWERGRTTFSFVNIPHRPRVPTPLYLPLLQPTLVWLKNRFYNTGACRKETVASPLLLRPSPLPDTAPIRNVVVSAVATTRVLWATQQLSLAYWRWLGERRRVLHGWWG